MKAEQALVDPLRHVFRLGLTANRAPLFLRAPARCSSSGAEKAHGLEVILGTLGRTQLPRRLSRC